MLKGCQKEMIVVHTKDSPLFEDAFFVLRPQKSEEPRGDILAEANRIIESGSGYFERRRRRENKKLWFLAGALVGIGVFFLAHALLGF